MRRTWLAFMVVVVLPLGVHADKLVRVAGGGTEMESNIPATKAKLQAPFGIEFDKTGDAYLVELSGGRFYKIDAKGMFHLLGGKLNAKGNAGDGGPAKDATFNGMHSLAIHHPTGKVYLADTWNGKVRVYDPKAGTISAFAGADYIDPAKKGKYEYSGDGGPAQNAKFSGIYCIAFNPSCEKLYITDLENRRIRVVDMKTGIVDLVAGNGEKGVPKNGADAKTSPLVDPRACVADRHGNVYILERSGHALRVVDAQGKIKTIVGTGKGGLAGDDGEGLQALLSGPKHLCIDGNDDVIIADTANHVIRKYAVATGRITRLAGTGKKGPSGEGGDPLQVTFNEPHGVFVHPNGTLYIVDSMNHRVFRLEK